MDRQREEIEEEAPQLRVTKGNQWLANADVPDASAWGPPLARRDRGRHESQLLALVVLSATLWTTSPWLALAPIPSGRPSIARLREQLRRSLFGDGFLPFVLAVRSGDPVVVAHHGVPDASPPTFEYVYVGIGDSSLQPMPWSYPIPGTSGN